jgi:amphi-Trp domain-containing protein
MGEMKKEIKFYFDRDSLAALLNQISMDMKSGYMSVGDLKIEVPSDVEVEIEYKEEEKAGGMIKCTMEWELKWYKK